MATGSSGAGDAEEGGIEQDEVGSKTLDDEMKDRSVGVGVAEKAANKIQFKDRQGRSTNFGEDVEEAQAATMKSMRQPLIIQPQFGYERLDFCGPLDNETAERVDCWHRLVEALEP